METLKSCDRIHSGRFNCFNLMTWTNNNLEINLNDVVSVCKASAMIKLEVISERVQETYSLKTLESAEQLLTSIKMCLFKESE